MRNRLRRHTDGLHLGLMLALTFSTGVIDAVGYLGLDRVFTGNMTGNVVILGMALTGADGLPVLGPIIALAAFMLGALAAGRVMRGMASGWDVRATALLAFVGVAITAASVAMLATNDSRPDLLLQTVTGVLGFAMGMQAGAARHIAVKDVTTVVVTSTMVGLAYDSRFGGNTKQQWKRRISALLLIGAGAALGALFVQVHIGLGMAVAALITVAVACIGHFARAESRAP